MLDIVGALLGLALAYRLELITPPMNNRGENMFKKKMTNYAILALTVLVFFLFMTMK
jgi:hypothetical protein